MEKKKIVIDGAVVNLRFGKISTAEETKDMHCVKQHEVGRGEGERGGGVHDLRSIRWPGDKWHEE